MCGPPLCSIHPLCVKNAKKDGVYWNVYVMDATEERAYEHYAMAQGKVTRNWGQDHLFKYTEPGWDPLWIPHEWLFASEATAQEAVQTLNAQLAAQQRGPTGPCCVFWAPFVLRALV